MSGPSYREYGLRVWAAWKVHVAVERLQTFLVGNSRRADKSGNPPLLAAAGAGEVERVKILLERGAEVNAPGPSRATALHGAAFSGVEEIAAMLLDAGAELDARTDTGASALLYASARGNLRVVQLLVGRGAQVNLRNIDGETPTRAAALSSHHDVAEFLRANGGVE